MASSRGIDESYLVGLVAELLHEEPSRQHRFDWLRGDTGVRLPVDAYFEFHGLVVEYRERQHYDRTYARLWDRRMTASGITRDKQRRRYDQRRKRLFPEHGLKLLVLRWDELARTPNGRLAHDDSADRVVVLARIRQLGVSGPSHEDRSGTRSRQQR